MAHGFGVAAREQPGIAARRIPFGLPPADAPWTSVLIPAEADLAHPGSTAFAVRQEVSEDTPPPREAGAGCDPTSSSPLPDRKRCLRFRAIPSGADTLRSFPLDHSRCRVTAVRCLLVVATSAFTPAADLEASSPHEGDPLPDVSAGLPAASTRRLPLLSLSMVESVASRGIAAVGPPVASLGFLIIPPPGAFTGPARPEGWLELAPEPRDYAVGLALLGPCGSRGSLGFHRRSVSGPDHPASEGVRPGRS